MVPVNIHQAKTHLSQLLERVERGEEIVIARAGRPIARLVAYRIVSGPRVGGQWRGLVRIGEDFDAPLPTEIAEAFGVGVGDDDDDGSTETPGDTGGAPSSDRSR